MYTFDTQYLGSPWVRSGRRFGSWYEAAQAAIMWAKTNYDNGEIAAIKIVEIKEVQNA